MAHFFKKIKQMPSKLLVSRTDRIGDFILTLPIFEAIKKELKLSLTVLCNQAVAPLLENNPFVDDIISTNQNDDPSSTARIIESRAFDSLLVLVNDPIIRKILPHIRNIPMRIGPINRPSLLFRYSHPVLQKRSRSIMNEAAYNLELLQQFGVKAAKNIKPRLYLSETEIQAFRSKYNGLFPLTSNSKSIVVLHPGMSGSALNLTRDKYAGILSGLLAMDFFVVLTGSGKNEQLENESLIGLQEKSSKNCVVNASGYFTLREYAVLISHSRLFIGPSTGPTHLANAVGTPLVSFYPPIQVQSATRWEPFLAKSAVFTPQVDCPQKYKCIGKKCSFFYCMDSIEIQDVLAAVKTLSL